MWPTTNYLIQILSKCSIQDHRLKFKIKIQIKSNQTANEQYNQERLQIERIKVE